MTITESYLSPTQQLSLRLPGAMLDIRKQTAHSHGMCTPKDMAKPPNNSNDSNKTPVAPFPLLLMGTYGR